MIDTVMHSPRHPLQVVRLCSLNVIWSQDSKCFLWRGINEGKNTIEPRITRSPLRATKHDRQKVHRNKIKMPMRIFAAPLAPFISSPAEDGHGGRKNTRPFVAFFPVFSVLGRIFHLSRARAHVHFLLGLSKPRLAVFPPLRKYTPSRTRGSTRPWCDAPGGLVTAE